jgi:hypothetical protein
MPHISFYPRKEPHGSAFQTKALLHDKMIKWFDIARFRASKKRIIHEKVTIDHNLLACLQSLLSFKKTPLSQQQN